MVEYLPGGHASHSPPSEPMKPALQTQKSTVGDPGPDDVSSGHATHVSDDIAPVASEYVSLGHSSHAPGPLSALYDPARHASHSPPFGPVKPALHSQSVKAVLPGLESALTGHVSVHGEVPPTALNLPGSQSSHSPPSGPKEPGLQVVRHSSADVLPGGDVESASGHWLQSPSPMPSLYLPLSHITHGPPSGPANPALH